MSVLELPPECSKDQTDCEVLRGLCFMNQGDFNIPVVAQVQQSLAAAACLSCKKMLDLSRDKPEQEPLPNHNQK